jgi:predicted ester cyclase
MTHPTLSRDEAINRLAQFFTSLSKQDIDAASQSLSPEVDLSADFLDDGSVSGSTPVASALKALVTAFPNLTLSITETNLKAVYEEPVLAAEVAINGTNAGELPGIGQTNRSMEATGAIFIRFQDSGLMTSIRCYFGWDSVLAQLGMRSFARPGPVP